SSDAWDGALYVDRAGIFGGDLIAVFNEVHNGSYNDVYRINSSGQVTRLAQVLNTAASAHSAVITLPNDVNLYGPWAGKILFGYCFSFTENSSDYASFHTIDTNG